MATTYAASVTAHAGIGHATSTTGATTKDLTATNNSSSSNNSSAGCNGFKVYGSLFKVDARYQFLNPLGKGSYGIVCAAKDRETGLSMAIKKVSPMAKRTVDAKHTLREVLLLQLLGRHPNVISIHNLSTNLKDDELYIVMDLMDTDLHRVIQSSQALSESHVKYFLHQLLRGVKYLHDNGVLHRDLKPGNLLLSKTCQLKIADFGLARKFPKSHLSNSTTGTGTSTLERPRSAPAASSSSSSGSSSASSRPFDRAPMTEHVVTRWYRAPELMLQPDGLYDQSVDMWSVGCIFAEILGRKALFPGKNFLHQLALIFDVLGTPPTEATTRIKSAQAQRFLKSLGKKPKVPFRTIFPAASDDAVDLLEKLLEFDPTKRISAQDALAHPYMQAIERKYKGADPHANTRGLDFSFDANKKLTKLDLRALIVKEVESFRKCVAHTVAIDNELSEEEVRERASTGGSSHLTSAKQQTKDKLSQPQHLTGAMPGASLPGAMTSSTKDSKTQARVMCGSAGMSMINSLLRQPLSSSQNQEQQQQPQVPQPPGKDATSSASVVTSGASSAIAIGSNRQRIRTTTKPPVPRQQGVAAGVLASNQQENQQQQQGRVTTHHTQSGSQLLTEQQPDAPSPPAPAMKAQSTEELAKSSQVALRGFLFTQAPAPAEADFSAARDGSHPRSVVAIGANGNVPDPAKAIAAAIALSERSKALISSLSKPATTEATGLSQRSSSNQLFASRSTAGKAQNNPECSSSSSSSDSDVESRDLRAALAHKAAANAKPRIHMSHQDAPSDASVSSVSEHPPSRRAASAGPTRTRSSLVAATNCNSGGTGFNSSSTAAFVGTTNSLIRAQRASNGQTLTESANQMLATMKRPLQELQNSHNEVERDESVVFAPPVQSTTTLKTQRSTSQLPLQQQQQQQPVVEKKVSKRLTVPKSPKFSVMSWQKKRGPIRPSSAAATSGATATTQASSTIAAMTVRK